MTQQTFAKCVQLFKRALNKHTLRLHNFGEVLLHPGLPDLIQHASEHGVRCSFFTNGLSADGSPFPRQYWATLARCGLDTVDFSSHQLKLEQFKKIVDGLVTVGRVFDPRTRVLGTWAGQTGRPEVPGTTSCLFERMPALVVLWDGRISTCCLDVEGRRSELWIDDLLDGVDYSFERLSLCGGCASMRHDESL